ncbi:hypothetical protein DICPUDRAFT_53966 [Dictyostelium purpureum]|uniref:Ergosterol biosynthetic protein 28 n=1 Tax=Dictyostelium purpureum TaxID=5786 RepID=F0ZF05_DICPU|nr:uncharacterized protein DICPUDRAFT_53966 [Dictyostelium purpureum]EGC37434.1 hypothetical protein DICPUDRAFT_53966 [Dictyostelium purpureum]|eukprot:XP_003285998.1 hypothetical protein DICPUDRAFT_53966 [Dictyostelium purpureum]
MEKISIWLLTVAGLRLLGASQAFFNQSRIKSNVYSGDPKLANPLFCRLFGSWTLMSFTLCIATAFNPFNKPLYFCTFVSFLIAAGHFITECFIFKTSRIKDSISPFIVAGTSIMWMGYQLLNW